MAMNRRGFVSISAGVIGTAVWRPSFAVAAAGDLPAGAVESGVLDALPGKRALIKRTYRPPNYETPLEYFRDEYTPNDAFYVRWHGAVIPDVARDDWRLTVSGPALSRPKQFSHADLTKRFEVVEVAAVNQCSGNRRGLFSPHVPGVQWGYGAMGNARWRGVRLKDVLETCGLQASAREVVANGADSGLLASPDFVKSLPMSKVLDAETLIAFEMNGAPLPHWNGFPARLVVPGWTATYWVKSLTDLTVTDTPFDGFWMKTAYRVPKGLFGPSGFDSQDTEANSPITAIRINSLLVEPRPGTKLRRGEPVRLLGIAWDGGSGVERVEMSTDGGRNWRNAELGRDLGRYAWRHFHGEVKPDVAGPLDVSVRAFGRDGATQAAALIQNPAGYHHNVVQSVRFDVA
jgi:DMSO/TMAO reductase YedYZ molybdopterin-dependent catalytic subunit